MGVCNARMMMDDNGKKHNSGMFRGKTAGGALDRHGYGCPELPRITRITPNYPNIAILLLKPSGVFGESGFVPTDYAVAPLRGGGEARGHIARLRMQNMNFPRRIMGGIIRGLYY